MWARTLLPLLFLAAVAALPRPAAQAVPRRPNIVLIVTDDQGYPDLGSSGNPVVRTPHLDAMAAHSTTFGSFYVSPVCTPTRASLMTGRYNYRTRAIDTFRGRAMMEPDEVTVAEVLRAAGYATGIWGKWHLGDNYPMRPQDQGFEEALVHRGGGIGQPSDPPGGEGKYTDPVLFHNGRREQPAGYCTDVYYDRAIARMERQRRAARPFFAYMATNCPHSPLDDVPTRWYDEYRKQEISTRTLPLRPGHPVPGLINADQVARVYAMISNIDENVGRLFRRLDELKITRETLVLFMTDNGQATRGYNAGLRGSKSTVYEGGIRSPLFAHWPGRFRAARVVEQVAAHNDLMPTLLAAAGARAPAGVRLDGRSLLPLLEGRRGVPSGSWPDRTLFFQAHRGDAPVRYHNFAARSQAWKLVNASGFPNETLPGPPRFELFDMRADPLETRDVAAEHPDVLARLRAAYDHWFDDVGSTRPDNYAPPRIHIGTPYEDPVVLTRQDWRPLATLVTVPWGGNERSEGGDRGHWEVHVAQAGSYDITLRFPPQADRRVAAFTLGDVTASLPVSGGAESVRFRDVQLPAGPGRLEAAITGSGETLGPMFVEVSRRR